MPKAGTRAHERGASLAEVLILVGLIAIIAFGAFRLFGDRIRGTVERQSECVVELDPNGCGQGRPAFGGPVRGRSSAPVGDGPGVVAGRAGLFGRLNAAIAEAANADAPPPASPLGQIESAFGTGRVTITTDDSNRPRTLRVGETTVTVGYAGTGREAVTLTITNAAGTTTWRLDRPAAQRGGDGWVSNTGQRWMGYVGAGTNGNLGIAARNAEDVTSHAITISGDGIRSLDHLYRDQEADRARIAEINRIAEQWRAEAAARQREFDEAIRRQAEERAARRPPATATRTEYNDGGIIDVDAQGRVVMTTTPGGQQQWVEYDAQGEVQRFGIRSPANGSTPGEERIYTRQGGAGRRGSIYRSEGADPFEGWVGFVPEHRHGDAMRPRGSFVMIDMTGRVTGGLPNGTTFVENATGRRIMYRDGTTGIEASRRGEWNMFTPIASEDHLGLRQITTGGQTWIRVGRDRWMRAGQPGTIVTRRYAIVRDRIVQIEWDARGNRTITETGQLGERPSSAFPLDAATQTFEPDTNAQHRFLEARLNEYVSMGLLPATTTLGEFRSIYLSGMLGRAHYLYQGIQLRRRYLNDLRARRILDSDAHARALRQLEDMERQVNAMNTAVGGHWALPDRVDPARVDFVALERANAIFRDPSNPARPPFEGVDALLEQYRREIPGWGERGLAALDGTRQAVGGMITSALDHPLQTGGIVILTIIAPEVMIPVLTVYGTYQGSRTVFRGIEEIRQGELQGDAGRYLNGWRRVGSGGTEVGLALGTYYLHVRATRAAAARGGAGLETLDPVGRARPGPAPAVGGDTIVINPAETRVPLEVPPGTRVTVRRTSGAIESDWQVLRVEGDVVTVGRQLPGQPALTRTVPLQELIERNPSLLRGQEVRVQRTSGEIEGGWRVESVLADGRLRLSRAGVGTKDVPLQRVLELNPELARGGVIRPPAPEVVTTGRGRAQSEEFQRGHRVDEGTPIQDGYADGGRGMTVEANGRVTSGREVLVVDRARDVALQRHLEYARTLRNMPEVERAQALARYVDQLMNPPGGRGAAQAAVDSWQPGVAGREVLLGDVPTLGGGVCRHRALLFKVLADEAGLNVSLVRGNLRVGGTDARPALGGHAWNELRLGNGERVIVDVMNPEAGFRFPATSTGGAYYGMNGRPLYTAPPAPPGPTSNRPTLMRPRAGAEGGTFGRPLARDLTAAESGDIARMTGDLQRIADGLDANPLAVRTQLEALRWGERVRVSWDEPIQIGESQFARLRTQADALAREAGVTPAEALEYLVDQEFGAMLRARQAYYYDPRTGVTHLPREIQVYGGGRTRALDMTNPVERMFAQRHARCQIEELSHGAGFGVRPGEYVPMSPRIAEFDAWLQRPQTQAWLAERYSAAEIAEMRVKLHEADVTELLRGRSPHNPAELGRYPVREAYMRFLEESARATERTTRLQGLAEHAYPRYSAELQPAMDQVRRVLGDFGEVQGRAKDPISAANRLERAIDRFGAEVGNVDQVLSNLWDAVGTRVVLRDTSAAGIDAFVNRLARAIRNNELQVTEINNLHGPGGRPYFTPEHIRTLQQAAADARVTIRFNESRVMDSGYTAGCVYLRHGNGVLGELQIMGPRALELANLEHIPYDVSLGKPLVRGLPAEALPELGRIMQPIEQAMRGWSPERWAIYNRYMNQYYQHMRTLESGGTSTAPTLPEGFPQVVSIDGLRALHQQITQLRNRHPAR